MNLATSAILHPSDACDVMYSLFPYDDCEGIPYTSDASYATATSLNQQLNEAWFDGQNRKQIRSIKHPAASRLEIFERENFEGGSFLSENRATVEQRPQWICTTFAQKNGNDMDQMSIKFEYEDCGVLHEDTERTFWN